LYLGIWRLVVTGRLQHTDGSGSKERQGRGFEDTRWKKDSAYDGLMGDVLGVRSAHEGATDLGHGVCEDRNAWNVSTAADPSRQEYRGVVNWQLRQ
jgi:hypothetical protein